MALGLSAADRVGKSENIERLTYALLFCSFNEIL